MTPCQPRRFFYRADGRIGHYSVAVGSMRTLASKPVSEEEKAEENRRRTEERRRIEDILERRRAREEERVYG